MPAIRTRRRKTIMSFLNFRPESVGVGVGVWGSG